MKKFKLIKEYPGSQKLGFIFDETIHPNSLHNKNITFSIQCYPEFWQEVVEKDYEILSFKTCGGYIQNYNSFNNPSYYRSYEYWVECHTKSVPISDIWSIKRLSDGEVFTVGDKVQMFKEKSNIKAFRILDNGEFVIDFENKCATTDLESIQKTKQLLFTTEDGVDIHEGDTFCRVTKDFDLWDDTGKVHINYAKPEYWEKLGIKHFSTKKKAEEYIIINKPVLSVNDIINLGGVLNWVTWIEDLKKLVKTKITK